ncbi:hypothetical protein Ciccas_013509 [Cichlidogyrus casuarinus]|uniref:Amino acid transporter transmembrane domain-containing protein n=1 Tax=Cichlidogyrus casuarinus TaxID=1844966 RepID=A0ABD2PKE1_9PLAT
MNACLGAGILAFPLAYHRAGGVLVSMILQTIFLIPACIAMIYLGYASDIRKTDSYERTLEVVAGRPGKIFFSIILFLYTTGTCITFLIIIGDLLDRVLATLICLPMSIPRDISFLRHASALGVVCVFYLVGLIFSLYFTQLPPPGPIKTRPDHWTDVFLVLPTICFGYQCHICTVPVYASMKARPSLKHFAAASMLAIIGAMAVYSVVGICGYWSFGALVQADITTNYPPSIPVLIGIALMEKQERYGTVLSLVLTLVCYTCNLLLAVFVSDISVVIGWLGALAAIFAYAGPGFIMFRLCVMERSGQLQLFLSDEEEECLINSSDDEDSLTAPVLGIGYYTRLILSISLIVVGSFIFGLTVSISAIDSFAK